MWREDLLTEIRPSDCSVEYVVSGVPLSNPIKVERTQVRGAGDGHRSGESQDSHPKDLQGLRVCKRIKVF